MVKSYWDRRQDAKAAILAAREAIDALERHLERYCEVISSDTGYKTYLRLEHERHLSNIRAQALMEAGEAAQHLGDAIRSWWDYARIKDRPDEPSDPIADDPGPNRPDAA